MWGIGIPKVVHSFFKHGIKEWFSKTKRIAIFGDTGVGKTTFINYMRDKGTTKPSQTLHMEEYKKIKVNNVTFTITDIGGSKDQYANWRKICQKADYVLYLFNSPKIHETETKEKIHDDMSQIFEYLIDNKNIKRSFIIGTHCDRANICNISDIKATDSHDNMLASLGGADNCQLLLGSLKTKKGFNYIFKDIRKGMDNEK